MENGNIYQGFKGTVLKEFITNFENSENGNCCGEQGLRERDELKAVNEAVTSLYITAMMGEQKERVSNSNRQHLVFLTSKHFEKVLLPYFSPATTATWVESNAIESERRRQYKWKTAVKKEEVCRLKKQFSNQEILKLEYFNFQINAVGIDKFSRCLKQLLQSDEELSDLQNRKRELSKMKLKGVQTTFYNDSKVAITDDSTDCQPPIVLQEHANYYSFFSYSLLFTILLQEVSNRKKVKAWKHLNCGRLDEENSTNNGGVLQDADSERIFSFCSNIGIGGEKINKLEKNGSSHMPSFFPFPLMRGCSEIIAKDEKKQPLNVCNGRNGPVEGESTNQPAANRVQDGETPSQKSLEKMAIASSEELMLMQLKERQSEVTCSAAGSHGGICDPLSDLIDETVEERRRKSFATDAEQNNCTTGGTYRSSYYKPSSQESQAASPPTKELKLSYVPCLPAEQVTFAFLQEATNHFESLIGEGSYGQVFKASLQLQDKVMLAAVKKFKPPKDGKSIRSMNRQFSAEMKALLPCQHPNVVKLLAYCTTASELCTVYELVEGGTLRQALLKSNQCPLSMEERFGIALGTSDALKYLHVKHGLIHRDVKTSNLLLTKDRTVKVGDFGLAAFLNVDESNLTSFMASQCMGTRVYMAPEAFKGKVSRRVDVYAFGMVLYEIASGLPSYSSSKSTDLVMYMKELDEEGVDLEVMIDPRTLHTKGAKEASLKLFDIARACTNMDDKERPQMSSVYNLLQDLHFKFETMQKSTRKDSSDDL
eukprot:m.102775 g.102775  ORF g.102775 m.102775 type:complete len:767 (+) comp37183_c1_seq4:179-2479(+)